MKQRFLDVFPREIRDHIYTFILASPSGAVTLSPWTVEVARSLSILRTCKQIKRECKDIIWRHRGLRLQESTRLHHKLKSMGRVVRYRKVQELKLSLELLDRDELQWMARSLPALKEWCRLGMLRSIVLLAHWEKPCSVPEFKEILALRRDGEPMDGRLYLQQVDDVGRMTINTSWPRFCKFEVLTHWGKQRWLREMLLDSTGVDTLLAELHHIFGGKLFVNGQLRFADGQHVSNAVKLDPRNGEIRIVP